MRALLHPGLESHRALANSPSVGAGACHLARILTLVVSALVAPLGARADESTPAAAWESLPLTEQVTRLDTPTSGAFFARTREGLLRSDDGGLSWTNVPLPPPPETRLPIRDAVVVDPTNHAVLFSAGKEGVYRSTSEPIDWQLRLPTSLDVLRISISPADPAVIYAAVAQGSTGFQVFRSDDRGDSWTSIIGPSNGAICGWTIPILDPTISNPDRLFGSWRCHAGRELPSGGQLQVSSDRGMSWTDSARRSAYFSEQVVGGAAANPDRFYSYANRGAEPGGGFVARTDDGGVTWTDVFVQETRPAIGGIAMDPGNPDRVFIGIAGGEQSVLASVDAGQTWTPLGAGDIGPVRAVALGIDGANLFVATERGLWRYALPAPVPPTSFKTELE